MVNLSVLETIIAPRYVRLLIESGIDTVEALVNLIPKEIKKIEGIGSETLIYLVKLGQEILDRQTGAEKEKVIEFLTTGNQYYDHILNGGIPTGQITPIDEHYCKEDKDLSMRLSVMAQLSKDRGGLEGSVLYIDSCNSFSKSKIAKIANYFGVDEDLVLKRIMVARVYSQEDQFGLLKISEPVIKEHHVKLIVINNLFPLLLIGSNPIRKMPLLDPEASQLDTILSRIAKVYNIAIVVTNRVAV